MNTTTTMERKSS